MTLTGGRSTGRRRSRARLLLLPLVVLVGVSIGLAIVASGGPSSAPATVAPRPAAAFRLAPVRADAGAVTLAAAAGHPVILSFFASWCDGCQQEMGIMAQVARLGSPRVRVIGVDVRDGAGPARTLLRRNHITYPVGADVNGTVAAAYGLAGLPTTVFLDAGHRIVGESVGPLTPAVAGSWVHRLERLRSPSEQS